MELMKFQYILLPFTLLILSLLYTPAFSNIVLSKVNRHMDLTSHIVRVTTTLQVENTGSEVVSDVLLAFPDQQARHLAYLVVVLSDDNRKATNLHIQPSLPEGMPAGLSFYSVSLLKGLSKSESIMLGMLVAFTRVLKPFPEQITMAGAQLVVFQDSANYLSPYPVKYQSLIVKLPNDKIESYTKLDNAKANGSEIIYGPYEYLPSLAYSPIAIHYESNHPFAVAPEVVREIEISHWGSIQITEHYTLLHAGAQTKGEFSRLDFQMRPNARGASAFTHLMAKLPPQAHSIYYRDAIGNISTSHVRGDSKKTELIIEPRYPMFGGWKTAFTIGYVLPLKDFLFQAEEKRFLNISFGSPMIDLVIDNLIVKVVLPEGSSDIYFSTPFPVKQSSENKISHLDITGRPVVVLQRTNSVPEHNQYFQVHYKFNMFSMLREPLMLISGFFLFFVACIVYMHADISISRSSTSYLAKQQWDHVQTVVQQVQNIIHLCLATDNKLEASLRDLSRTGDVHACKIARKAGDGLLKELSKELKPLMAFLQSSPSASPILTKVEELVAKEKELQDRLMAKHSTVVDCYEKKMSGKDIDKKVSQHQQKITALRQDVDDLLEIIDEI
ncbi:hypothetical protein ACFE04_015885 [Oxalis oulophora]